MTVIQRSLLRAIMLSLAAAIPAAGAEPSAAEKSAVEEPAAAKAKPRVLVTISKETTYITEPLRPDGYPDYVAALNQRASQAVTPENNASVLFWRAMGPRQIEPERDKFFRMLGIPTIPEKGDFFISLTNYIKDLKEAAGARPEEELDVAVERPWSRQQFPVLARWLKANEKPLGLVTEASKRPRRYDPILCSAENSDPLVSAFFGQELVAFALLVGVYQYQEVASASSARAMLGTSEGRADEAWEDLLTCHRLARLAAQGQFTGEAWHYAGAIERIAGAADRALAGNAKLSASQLLKMRADLAKLAPMPKMAEKFNIGERFASLDFVRFAANGGSLSAIRRLQNTEPHMGCWAEDPIHIARRFDRR